MSSDSNAYDLRALQGTILQPSDSKATGAPSGDPSLHPSSRNQPHKRGSDTDGGPIGRTELLEAGHNQGTAGPISAVPLPDADKRDLHRQLTVVEQKLREGWHTIPHLAELSGGSHAGVSARIRDCRKLGWNVERSKLAGFKRRYAYRITGKAPLVPAKRRPRDSEIDELRAQLSKLAALIEELRAELKGGQK